MSERGFFYDGSDANSDIQTNLHGTRKAKYYGTVERDQYKHNKENVNRINRITAVREQEKQNAKKNRKQGKEFEKLTQEEEFNQQKLQEYLALQEKIEKLKEAKRLAEEESGQAHRNAQVSDKLREDRERHQREEGQKNKFAAAERARQAAVTQKDLEEQMYGPRRKYLENQKKVLEEESNRAHQLAAEYREKEKDRSEEREDYTPYEEFNKNISKGVYKKKVVGDYSKSQIHNSIVVSHSGEGQVSAFDAARMEEERATTRRQDFRASKDDVRMKSLERWQVASKKEKEKKIEKEFEDQMKRLQKAKNLQKIEEGKKYPEQQIKPATKLQQQNRNQKLAEKEFEDMFMDNKPGNISMKGKKTTTRPPFKAPTLKPAGPHPLVEQSTLSGGFDNTTNRTNEFQEQDHEESEEEEQPRSTAKEPSARDAPKSRQPHPAEPSYQEEESQEEEEEEEEEEEPSELASSKKYNNYNDASQSQSQSYSQSRYEQTPEESTMRQEDTTKRHGLMSFGDRQRGGAQQVEAPSSSSYQQESQYGLKSETETRNNSQYGGYGADLGQSQSSALSDSRYRGREEESSSVQEKSQTKQRKGLDNDINSYINEQENFLQNLENHRKKLNEKLKTTHDNYSSPTAFEQGNKANKAPQAERQAPNNKSSLSSTSKTVAVQEDEAIEDLQKRANDLLSRFMNPTQGGQKSEEESEAEEEDSLEYSPAKYGKGLGLGDTKSTQNNYMEQTQSYAYSQDDLEEEKGETPEKNNRYRANARDDSPSELDYSMSAGERSEKKQKASVRMDYGVSFGTKQFVPPTETFGKTKNPFEDRDNNPKPVKEDKKAWKMEFEMADEQKPKNNVRNTVAPNKVQEQRERPSTGANNKQGQLVEEQGQGPSLAELFQKNRKKMVEKYEQHQKEHPEKPEVKEAKPVRTKEEILKQRKAMMEYKAPLSVKAKEKNAQEREEEGGMNNHFQKSRKSKSKEPKPELLDRLAFGKKATVDKKEMLKLTNKNYELLPEVKKRKEEEKKKEEQRQRRENAKKLDKEIRSKLMK